MAHQVNGFSLIDQVMNKQNNKELKTTVTLDFNKMPFLKDHAFHGRIVTPAVLFLEMIGENALLLFPDYHMTSIKRIDFKGFLWLNEDKATQVMTEIKVSDFKSDSVTIEGTIYYEHFNKTRQIKRKRMIAIFEALLKPANYQADLYYQFPFFLISDQIIEKEEIYPDLVGLGESFNQLDSVLQLSPEKGITGLLLKTDDKKQTESMNWLLGDPFIRDSAYHLASIFGNHVMGGFNVPFSMSGIHFHKALKDKSYFCLAQVIEHTSKESTYSLKIIDNHGLVVESYSRISYTYSVNIRNDPVHELIKKRMARIGELESLTQSIQQYIPDVGIWSVNMVQKIESFLLKHLTNDEIAIYKKYLRKKSQVEFLGGRLLSKLCLLQTMKKKVTSMSDFTDLNIKRSDNGSPELFVQGYPKKMPFFSISHKNDYIFCITHPSRKVGIDVEGVSERLIKVKEKYVSGEEETLLLTDSPDARDSHSSLIRRYTELWASKESIVKYLDSSFLEVAQKAVLKKIEDKEFYFIYNDLDGRSIQLKTVNFTYSNHIFSILILGMD